MNPRISDERLERWIDDHLGQIHRRMPPRGAAQDKTLEALLDLRDCRKELADAQSIIGLPLPLVAAGQRRRKELADAQSIIEAIAVSGVRDIDARLQYIEVQIDRDDWARVLETWERIREDGK